MKRLLTHSLALPLLLLATTSVFYFWPPEPDAPNYEPRPTGLASQYSWNDAEQHYRMIRGSVGEGIIAPEMIAQAERAVKAHSKRSGSSLGLELEPVGPDNIGGRTRAILVDRNNNQRIYAGSVSGGLYYSDDRAGTWEPHYDFINTATSSSIISSIAQAPNGDIYVGTGCTFEFGSTALWPGKGIAVSTDNGKNFEWILLDSISNTNVRHETWNAVNRLAFDPNTSRLYACTGRGLRIREWGETTWSNPILRNGTVPFNGVAHDIDIADDGSVLVVVGGEVFKSPNGDVGTYEEVTDNGFDRSSFARLELARAPSDQDVVYAVGIEASQDNGSTVHRLEGFYRSEDAGQTWTSIAKRSEDWFAPFGDQGDYNLALGVSPKDPRKVFIGGVELWQYDGDLHRHTSEGLSEFSPFYVHADKHVFYFDPTDDDVLYVGSDGGISQSMDGGETFITANKGFLSTQYYAVAFTPEGIAFGGTQDNGTQAVSGLNANDPMYGARILVHDGFDSEASQYFPIAFASSQFSLVARLETSNAADNDGELPTAEISEPYSSGQLLPDGGGPFHTVVRLWENVNDPQSRDSLTFTAEAEEHTLPRNNSLQRLFNLVVEPYQGAAIPIENSLEIKVGAMTLLTNAEDNSVLKGQAEDGVVSYEADGSIKLQFTLDQTVAEGIPIRASFQVRYEANSVLDLQSATNAYAFQHVLSTDLDPGESIVVQDPVQSLLAVSFPTTDPVTQTPGLGLSLTRDALKLDKSRMDWLELHGLGSVTCVEFSADGNIMFVGTGPSFGQSHNNNISGRVWRISGLNDLYSGADIPNLEREVIFESTQTVTGMALDPNNAARLVVTLGNYGQEDYVHFTDEALADDPDFASIQGDLPKMPVYDAEIDANDPNIVLLGTDFGIWSSSNLSDDPAAVSWADENGGSQGLTYLPIFDVRQQRQHFGESQNYYDYYFATHGRGIWRTGTLAVLSDGPELETPGDEEALDLKLYPNPMADQGTLEVHANQATTGTMQILDLQGRLVSQQQVRLTAGLNQLPVDVVQLSEGVYLLTLKTPETQHSQRMVVSH